MRIGNTLNNVGKFTTLNSVIGGIFMSCILSGGLVFVVHSKSTSNFHLAKARISNVKCESYSEEVCQKNKQKQSCRNITRYNCIYDVTFKTKSGKTITTQMTSNSKKVFDNEITSIEYNINNPMKVRNPIPYDGFIYVLGAVLCCILSSTLITASFSGSRSFRQYHATSTGLSMVSKALN